MGIYGLCIVQREKAPEVPFYCLAGRPGLGKQRVRRKMQALYDRG